MNRLVERVFINYSHFILAIICISLVACGSDTPSDSEGLPRFTETPDNGLILIHTNLAFATGHVQADSRDGPPTITVLESRLPVEVQLSEPGEIIFEIDARGFSTGFYSLTVVAENPINPRLRSETSFRVELIDTPFPVFRPFELDILLASGEPWTFPIEVLQGPEFPVDFSVFGAPVTLNQIAPGSAVLEWTPDPSTSGTFDLSVGLANGSDPDIIAGFSASLNVVPACNNQLDYERRVSCLSSNGFLELETSDLTNNANQTSMDIGDFNGDGRNDTLVTLSIDEQRERGPFTVGYLIFGGFDNVNQFDSLEEIATNNGAVLKAFGARFDGIPPRISLNASTLTGIGDINADGFNDIALAYADSVHILYGHASSLTNSVILDRESSTGSARFIVSGSNRLSSVAPAGDFNADGSDDFLIALGSTFGMDDQIHIIFGGRDYDGSLELDNLLSQDQLLISDNSGIGSMTVQPTGDFNGDGFDDVLFSDRFSIENSLLIFGNTRSGEIDSEDLQSGLMQRFINSGEGVATRVQGNGDFNGDGLGDLLINFFNLEGRRIIVLFGNNNNNQQPLDVARLSSDRVFSILNDDFTPGDVHFVGDVNEDGRDDISATYDGYALRRVDSDNNVWSSYLVYGSSSPQTIELRTLLESEGGKVFFDEGFFEHRNQILVPTGISGTPIADLNGDNKPEIAYLLSSLNNEQDPPKLLIILSD